jgi:hypothetical protein
MEVSVTVTRGCFCDFVFNFGGHNAIINTLSRVCESSLKCLERDPMYPPTSAGHGRCNDAGSAGVRGIQGACIISSSLARSSLCTPARRFMTFFFRLIAYSWVFHVYPWLTGTAGAGTTAGEVLHGMGVEVGYPGRFRIW